MLSSRRPDRQVLYYPLNRVNSTFQQSQHSETLSIRAGTVFLLERQQVPFAFSNNLKVIEPHALHYDNVGSKRYNSKLRDELLNGEVFSTLKEVQVLISTWRTHYN